MSHAELHLAVRGLLVLAFKEPPVYSVAATSIEYHPGRVDVTWSVAIHTQPAQIVVRGESADVLLKRLRCKLNVAEPEKAPRSLRAVGDIEQLRTAAGGGR